MQRIKILIFTFILLLIAYIIFAQGNFTFIEVPNPLADINTTYSLSTRTCPDICETFSTLHSDIGFDSYDNEVINMQNFVSTTST